MAHWYLENWLFWTCVGKVVKRDVSSVMWRGVFFLMIYFDLVHNGRKDPPIFQVYGCFYML